VVAISDIHFNPFDDPTLYPELAAAPASQWKSIFQSAQSLSNKAPSAWGSDTNYPALVLALAGVKQNLGSSPVILFSGDMLGHDLTQCFYELYTASTLPSQLNPATCPLNPTTTAPEKAAMQSFLDKTVAFVSMQIRAASGNVPVIFVPGNIDTYSLYGTGPDTTFLSDNANTFYTQLLNGSTDQASFQSTFTTLGSYSAQPLGSNLLVIALDSNPFAQSPYLPPLAPYTELTWLDSQLAAAQSAGQKVWLVMHVPPGANTTGTAKKVGAFNSSTQITDDEAAMMWQPQYQIQFMQILSKYPGLIAMGITGHTHMDEFRVLPTGDVMFGIPGISPVFGNNPAFKIFTISRDTQMPMNYQSISYNLAVSPAPAQFSSLYTFSTAYDATANTTLESSFQQLYPQLTPTAPGTATFLNYYVSSSATFPWNMANTGNWPLYSCGFSQMDEQDYVDCVNSY
jgi:sphingomyelin phosphodiesterase acid-like 3